MTIEVTSLLKTGFVNTSEWENLDAHFHRFCLVELPSGKQVIAFIMDNFVRVPVSIEHELADAQTLMKLHEDREITKIETKRASVVNFNLHNFVDSKELLKELGMNFGEMREDVEISGLYERNVGYDLLFILRKPFKEGWYTPGETSVMLNQAFGATLTPLRPL